MYSPGPDLGDGGLLVLVVFVLDLAHDLLDQVLHGHEAGDAAVLVDDEGHLLHPLLEFLEELRRPSSIPGRSRPAG